MLGLYLRREVLVVEDEERDVLEGVRGHGICRGPEGGGVPPCPPGVQQGLDEHPEARLALAHAEIEGAGMAC